MNETALKPGFLSRSVGPLHINLDRQLYGEGHVQSFQLSEANQSLSAFNQKLFEGGVVNPTENRPASHWALRSTAHTEQTGQSAQLMINGRDELVLVRQVQNHMEAFVEEVRSGRYTTPDGVPYENLLHLGIGGSDLGPRLLNDVFAKLELAEAPALNIQFAANVDFHEMKAALAALNPKTTLVVIASKSFSTRETLHNAQHIFKWLDAAGPQYRAKALVAATCKPSKAVEFGVDPQRVFEFSESVGGRYSLWGPVSIGIRMVHGNAAFNELLKGAALIDQHVRESEASQCIPTLLAMSDLYNLEHGVASLMLSPYDSRLSLLSPYLQQLWMESLGKGVDKNGKVLNKPACPILWGDVGTNGQHAFFQMLHQSRIASSVELIVVVHPNHDEVQSHQVLLSHALAQSEAFSVGRLNAETELNNPEINFRSCPGKRPVQMVFLDSLTPYSLGALLCMWEHRTAALAALQNINPFDQWGVELGKGIAEQLEQSVPPGHAPAENPVTAHLIEHFLYQAGTRE
ncbi:glucose-6-phosphate isomerase [Limnobacter thiooxidans]|uniref:Glucose-6-phosphate isomerase n=1 Tax=Limnobacter thiooxidans TaxID=131080 RepID=A0AA86J405_9BURK|nr:glucose-6-phosphate isomerase [Limnobacter thiooxidans]BET26814.1 glucose-6-phosphate isomerase [Limnobacter thiooxidans]